jgi:CSLREA domain-containing protein
MFTGRVLLLAALACAAMDCGAGPGGVVVNDFGDAGPGNCTTLCTLRDAISTALASIPPKTVTFSGLPVGRRP